MNLNNVDGQVNHKAVVNGLSTLLDPMVPNKFDGKHFYVWKRDMELYLTRLKLDQYLTDDKPVNTDVFKSATEEAWIHGDYEKTSKSLWLSLENNHRADVARRQHLATSKFIHFEMVDSKPIVQQIENFQSICVDLNSEDISLCNTFIVNCFIEKIPPKWVNFSSFLRRIRGNLTSLDDILIRVKFEDTNKNLKENQTSSIGTGKLKGTTARLFKKIGSCDKNPKEFVTNVESISCFNIMI
ncbi:hypothetical protein Bca4012_057947 [Brassica carinata]